MEAKQIKSFTVDGATYNAIVKLFKKHRVNVSLSAYVDGLLKELLSYARNVESILQSHEGMKEHQELMNQMIERVVFRKKGIDEDHINSLLAYMDSEIDEFEARKQSLTVTLYRVLRGESLFRLSKDRLWLVNKQSGEKLPTFRTEDGLLGVDMRTKG